MATNLDSIFKKKGKAKKPAVLNLQAAAAALESTVNQNFKHRIEGDIESFS